MKPTKKNKSALPQAVIDQYDRLLHLLPGIERKGAKNPYTSYQGNMFTFLDPQSGELSIRLPKKERETFIRKYSTTLSVQYGAIMKEYVVVPNELFFDLNQLLPYMEQCFEYVKSLPDKTSKKD